MRSVLLAACLAVFPSLLVAQSDHGSIIGIVSDPATRLVQSAPIVAKNVDTGKQYSAESNETGHYRIADLPPGTYDVSVRLPQFKEFVATGIKPADLRPARVDIVLEAK
jgi:hypothetical protein